MTAGMLSVLGACGGPTTAVDYTDGYPMPGSPPNTFATAPVAIGDPGWVVVLFIEPHPDDRIEFIGAEPIGSLDGADVDFYLSRPVRHDDGTTVLGEHREPLEGATVEGGVDVPASAEPGLTVGIIAEIVPQGVGRFVLESVRLRYRLNGGPEQVSSGIHSLLVVCADDPAPTACEDPALP
jgi:hypothetical protein